MAYSEDSIAKLTRNPLLNRGDELVRVDPATITEVDILPAYAEIGLGQFYDFVDFNDDVLIEHMRQEGMTDAQIAQHKFVFTNKLIDYGKGRLEQGVYTHNGEDLRVMLHPRALLTFAANSLCGALRENWRWDEASFINPDLEYSVSMSRTVYHEIRHMKQHVVEGSIDKEEEILEEGAKLQRALGVTAGALAGLGGSIWFESLLQTSNTLDQTVAMSMIALAAFYGYAAEQGIRQASSFKRYFKSPIEVDARSVEHQAPENAITLTPKEEHTAKRRQPGTLTRRKLFNYAYAAATGKNLPGKPGYSE